MVSYRNTFGSRLIDLRERLNLKVKDVADQLQFSPQAYSQYEHDHREPDLATTYRIAQFFGVTMEYLITGKGIYEEGIRPHLNESLTTLPQEGIDELILFYDYLQYKYRKNTIYDEKDPAL